MGWDERQTREFAAEHHGVIHRENVLRAGGSDEAIQSRLARGTWRQIHYGVYYLNVTQPTWTALLCAAVLAAGPDSRASHRAAGKVWGLQGYRSQVLEVTVPYSELPEPVGVIVHRTRRPLPGELVDSIRVTTIERTLLDMAALLPVSALEKAVRSAVRKRLTTGDRLAALVTTQGGRGVRGSRKLRGVIADVEYDKTGSTAEVDMLN